MASSEIGEHQRPGQADWQIIWQSQANRLNLALRNFLSWEPGCYRERAAGSLDFITGSKVGRAEFLLVRYGLSDLPQRASQQRLLETLTYLDWLDGMAEAHQDWFTNASNTAQTNTPPMRWLDVGAKNWAYVEALAGFAHTRYGEHFQLDGVELDPNRRYTNWQTRGQAAKAFAQAIPQASYHAGDIREWAKPAHIISLFLPFVFEEPHLAWGLPLDYFQPQALLNHILNLLPPEGLLIVVNQGAVEAEAQARLFQQACQTHPILVQDIGPLASPFIEYKYPRYGYLCRKQSD